MASAIIETVGDKHNEVMEVPKGSIFLSYAGVDKEAAAGPCGQACQGWCQSTVATGRK
jgi:hypothetical protein